MKRFALCCGIVGALALTVGARLSSAQELAMRGSKVFMNKGCNVCHTIGRSGNTAEGPDLAGVTDRRTKEWLTSWLKDPNAMFGSDAAADAMFEQYHHVKMPNMHLGEGDIAALIAYLGQHHQK